MRGDLWEDLMAFNDQNLVHSRLTPCNEEEGGDNDIQLVTKIINTEEVVAGNIQEEVVTQ